MVTSAMSARPSACACQMVWSHSRPGSSSTAARGASIGRYPANAAASADAASATAWLATSTAPPIVMKAWIVPS